MSHDFTTSDLEALIKRSRCYAGIGSRSTPREPLLWVERIAAMLGRCGLMLRSGAAMGTDSAFERGCDLADAPKEIFLPWQGFNHHDSPHHLPPPAAATMAARIHPNWSACSFTARRLHERNCQQILGPNLDDPVDFVLFYAIEKNGHIRGGTATAVTLAREMKIPTFNLAVEESMLKWKGITRRAELARVTRWRKLFESGGA